MNAKSSSHSLFLLRHAKSSWDSGASNDFSRPLSKRGLRDARTMGKLFQQRGWQPQWVIHSASRRTTQTVQQMPGLLDAAQKVIASDTLYLASVRTMLEMIRNTPPEVDSLMLVGHNPGMEQLLEWLCPAQQLSYQADGKLFTTANVAHLAVATPWQDITEAQAELLEHIRPKTVGNIG